ncbi:MAG: GNAT family N-acetyltransferase [Bacteroidota bacterium]
MTVRNAVVEDAPRLSDIAYAAKAHWGYPAAWLELWRDDLTITASFIASKPVFKLVGELGEIIGFCAFVEEEHILWVDHLWIAPEYIGKGYGRKLFREAFARVRKPHHRQAKVISDPYASGFYQKEGFIPIDYISSKPEGRRLPVLSKEWEMAGRVKTNTYKRKS